MRAIKLNSDQFFNRFLETKRKKPTDRSIIPDEMATFTEVHQIKSLSDIDSSMCPSGFVLEMHQNTAIFYNAFTGHCVSEGVLFGHW